jgi:AcrR family transcriptional regulator
MSERSTAGSERASRVRDQQGAKRRRGQALENAIFQAVRAELAEVGYANFTIEKVAVRAQTSKAVIYRRWALRAELIVAAHLHGFTDREDLPDTGSLRSDVIAILQAARQRVMEVGVFTIWGVLTESQHDPELAEATLSDIVAATREHMMVSILDRAVARGEVDRNRLTLRKILLPLDLFSWELLTRKQVDDDVIVEIVDHIFLPLVVNSHS